MSDELKTCPWCGGPAHVKIFVDGFGVERYSVGCDTPGCFGWETTANYPSEREAVVEWNQRRPVDIDKLLELADVVHKMGEQYDEVSSWALGSTFRAIADRISEACGVSE